MTDPPATPKRKTIKIQIPEGLEVVYANLARIAHSPSDIVIDFAHLLPNEDQAQIKARVLMSPLSAKLFYRALGENLARFESSFGEINIPQNTTLADNLFRPFKRPPSPDSDPDQKE
ncbi:MAG: DUF3467 domain-containing protein [Anaerolineales bacterium]|nr:DUF3467 domain-containing protein [Anaerolineales bacterium]